MSDAIKPLAEIPLRALHDVNVVLSDIDDTITTEGRLTAAAYDAIERLHRSGLKVAPITGRPAGWCDHIARMWPVDAVVGENGAFYMAYDRKARRMRRHSFADEPALRANRQRLDTLATRILSEVPGSGLASDQPYRVADLAIDFCEDVAPLPDRAIERIVSLFKEAGAQAKVSSIHVNGWFGAYDKMSMTAVMLAREFHMNLASDNRRMIFIGDSPNDEPMFATFELSVGVANIAAFTARLKAKPKYIARATSGAGFIEVAELLLAARSRKAGASS